MTLGGGTSGSSNTDYIVCAGLLTSSRSDMVFSIVLPHSLDKISNVNLTASKVYVRSILADYIVQGVDLVTAATTISIGITGENIITISARKTNGWITTQSPINNSPIVVQGGFVFSFS